MPRCAICDQRRQVGLDFCEWCFNEYREYIQQKPKWFNEVKAYAQRERRRIKKEYLNISLDWIAKVEYETD